MITQLFMVLKNYVIEVLPFLVSRLIYSSANLRYTSAILDQPRLWLSSMHKITDNTILTFVVTPTKINNSMSRNPSKSIWIAVIIAVVLTLVTSPSTTAACMETTVDSFDSAPWQKEAVVPLYCLAADCLLSHHILTNGVDNEALLPNRSTPKENVYPICSATSVTTETSLDPQKPPQRDPTQELPTYLYTQYHCRNCLDSEEPYQV